MAWLNAAKGRIGQQGRMAEDFMEDIRLFDIVEMLAFADEAGGRKVRSTSIPKNLPNPINAGIGSTRQPVSAPSFADMSGHCGTRSTGMSNLSSPAR